MPSSNISPRRFRIRIQTIKLWPRPLPLQTVEINSKDTISTIWSFWTLISQQPSTSAVARQPEDIWPSHPQERLLRCLLMSLDEDFGIPWRHSVEQSNESIQRHHSPCLDRDTSDSFKARRHCFWLTLSNASCHLTLLHITLLLAEPQWLPRRKCEYLFWKRNRQLYISSGISQRFNLHHCIPTQAKYQTTYFNIIRTEPGVVNFTSCIPLTAYTTAISLLDAGWRTVTF